MTYYPDITVKANSFDLSLKEQAQAFAKWVLGMKVPLMCWLTMQALLFPAAYTMNRMAHWKK